MFISALILLYVQAHISNQYLSIFHLAVFLFSQNISKDTIIILPTNLLPFLISHLLDTISLLTTNSIGLYLLQKNSFKSCLSSVPHLLFSPQSTLN